MGLCAGFKNYYKTIYNSKNLKKPKKTPTYQRTRKLKKNKWGSSHPRMKSMENMKLHIYSMQINMCNGNDKD